MGSETLISGGEGGFDSRTKTKRMGRLPAPAAGSETLISHRRRPPRTSESRNRGAAHAVAVVF